MKKVIATILIATTSLLLPQSQRVVLLSSMRD